MYSYFTYRENIFIKYIGFINLKKVQCRKASYTVLYVHYPKVYVFLFQRIVLTGESGSGKTTTANYLMKMLVYLGRYMRYIFKNIYIEQKSI